jgi:hypothetical protein
VFLAIAVCIAVVISKVCGSVGRLWGHRKSRPQQESELDEYVQSLHEAHTRSASVDRIEHRLRTPNGSDQQLERSANHENASAPRCAAEDAHGRD